MTTTWIVVGHRAGARIIEYNGPGKPLHVVSELQHEASRLKSGALTSDRPGTSFSSGPGPGRHPMGSENAPHDRAATDFAKEIASTLQSARDEHRVTELVLVAEPRFLGMMRGALDAPTAALVRHTVNKDLAHVAVRDLPSHLESALTF